VTLLRPALERAIRDLLAQRARFALVGGLAVSVRCEPRFTRDLDLVVAVASDREAETLVHALAGAGYRALSLLEQETAHRLATVRLVPPGEPGEQGVVIDLLFASSGIESVVVVAAEPVEVFPGVILPVASVGHLIAMKLLARDDRSRPQDVADLRELLRVAGPAELEQARSAVAEIHRRGFNRNRDLIRALADLLAE